MSQQPEIVLISHWFGHTFHFMECVLPFFLKRGYVVYHVTDKPEEAERFLRERVDFGAGRIETIGMETVGPEVPSRRKDAQLCRVEAHWRGVQAALEKLYARLGRKVGIFHTWVDLYSHGYLSPRVIAEAMPAPWCGLYVHPAELRIFKTWKRRLYENVVDLLKMGRMFPCRLRAFDVPNSRKVYFLDEAMTAKARGCFRRNIDLAFFPEYTTSMGLPPEFRSPSIEEFRSRKKLILSLIGFLDKRKGLLTLIRVAKADSKSDWGFILGGEVRWDDFNPDEKAEIKDFLSSAPKNCLFLARSLQDNEFNMILAISDVLYLAYENFFHSSGVQLKAACFGKPMIAGPQHLIAERTRRFRMGWCLPEISSKAVSELLSKIDKRELSRVKSKALFSDFLEEHSPEALEKVLESIPKTI